MKVGRFGLGFKSVFHITGTRSLKKRADRAVAVKYLKLVQVCSRRSIPESVVGILHFCVHEPGRWDTPCTFAGGSHSELAPFAVSQYLKARKKLVSK